MRSPYSAEFVVARLLCRYESIVNRDLNLFIIYKKNLERILDQGTGLLQVHEILTVSIQPRRRPILWMGRMADISFNMR